MGYGHDSHVQNTHGGLGGLKTQLGIPLQRQKQLGMRKALWNGLKLKRGIPRDMRM